MMRAGLYIRHRFLYTCSTTDLHRIYRPPPHATHTLAKSHANARAPPRPPPPHKSEPNLNQICQFALTHAAPTE